MSAQYKHKEIAKDKDFTFDYTEIESNIEQTPTNASAVVYDNGGTSVATISGTITGNLMTFPFLTADNTDTGQNFKIIMTFTVNGQEKDVSFLFDVVLVPLSNTVNDENLMDRLKDLRGLVRFRGKTTSEGSTTTIIDTKLSADRRDWTGGRGKLLFDDEAIDNLDFTIQEYDDDSTLTFIPAYTANVPSGTKYFARMSYTNQIDNAFLHVMKKIRATIGPLAGYIDTNTINELVIFRTLWQICGGEFEEIDDKWFLRMKEFESEFDSLFGNFKEAYDKDQDSNISDEEAANPPFFGVTKLVR